MILKKLGIIYSPYKKLEQAPKQGIDSQEIIEIEIFKEYLQGLEDIEKFSRLIIFYWMHKADRKVLKIEKDGKEVGVFGTRAASRPNPIGICNVELIGREDNILKVRGLDAIHGTPVIDIKPYFKELDGV